MPLPCIDMASPLSTRNLYITETFVTISNLHLSANTQSVVLLCTCEPACLLNQAGDHMAILVQRDVNRRLMHCEAGRSCLGGTERITPLKGPCKHKQHRPLLWLSGNADARVGKRSTQWQTPCMAQTALCSHS